MVAGPWVKSGPGHALAENGDVRRGMEPVKNIGHREVSIAGCGPQACRWVVEEGDAERGLDLETGRSFDGPAVRLRS